MVQLVPFKVDPLSFHELIVQPMFGDVIDSETGSVIRPSMEEGDWNLVDSPKHSVPIIDVFGRNNLIKRKDSTCKLIYSQVGKLGSRKIEHEDLYAATEDCVDEFYQGSFKDWSTQNFEKFGELVMPIMEKGVAADIYTNKYFGDISRASDSTGVISWNKFNGIWPKYLGYVTSNVLAAPIAIPAGAITPSAANTLLDSMYAGQDGIMENYDDEEKCFYVDKDIYDAYGDYLLTMNAGALSLQELQAGRAKLYKRGIEVKWKKWGGVLKALNNGTKAHAAILTLRGNFLYKTDSTYGGGPNRNEAVRIWWSDDDGVWKRQIHFCGGTDIAAPQHSVLAITSL